MHGIAPGSPKVPVRSFAVFVTRHHDVAPSVGWIQQPLQPIADVLALAHADPGPKTSVIGFHRIFYDSYGLLWLFVWILYLFNWILQGF